MNARKIIGVILLTLIALYLFLTPFHKKEPLLSFTKNNTTIHLEIANTEKQREQGLMYRKFMPKNHGMIFIFPHSDNLRFWMKNTLIPLDMIFLNHNRIVAIISDVPPCKKETIPCPSYGPNIEADEVIELNAGAAKQLKLTVESDILLHAQPPAAQH